MQTDELGSHEGDLRALLDQTEELLQLAPAAIVVRDPETSAIRFWNRGAQDLYGWTPQEALGQVTHNLLRTVFPVPLAQVSAALNSLGHWEGDLVHMRRDGTPVPVASRQVVQRDASGRPLATLEVNIDISERRNAQREREERIRLEAAREELERGQAALRASELRYRQLVETANEGIWLVDLDGNTTFANPQMAVLLGTTPDAMLGRAVFDYCFDEDRELVLEHLAANIAGQSEQFDLRLRRIDGSPVYVLGGTGPVTDATGSVAGALGMFSDISDRRRAEQDRAAALEREHLARVTAEAESARTTRLQALTAALAAAVLPEEVGQVVAEQAVSALDAAAGAVVLVHDRDLEVLASVGFPSELIEHWRHFSTSANVPLAEAIRTRTMVLLESPADREARFRELKDSVLPQATTDTAAWAALPLLVNDTPIGALGLSWHRPRQFDDRDRAYLTALANECAQALDRSHLRAAERSSRAEAEAAVRSRDEFLALVSHDLRTPLTSIKIRSQLVRRRLERGGETAPRFVNDGLELIESTVDRLFLQVNELVDTARIQVGLALILERDDVDLVRLAQAAVDESIHDPLLHHVHVETPLATLVGRWDAVRLRRVLNNLLTNAVKYSPNGGDVVVRVRRDGGWALIDVADQGVGIPTAEIPRTFERFFRASNVSNRIPGEGIGLAAALHIAQQHGGTLEVQAEEGRGSTFTLRLPLQT